VEGDDGEYRSSGRGVMPLRWTSPEALESRQFSTASDVWAFGVLAGEVFENGATVRCNICLISPVC
jgi:hypothetical protein